jgi:hypothetical protein
MACVRAGVIALVLLGILALIVLFYAKKAAGDRRLFRVTDVYLGG